jgi:hypothetical protein
MQNAPRSKGHMYEVNINANPEHFLDWDKPLGEQSQHVQDALRTVLTPSNYEQFMSGQGAKMSAGEMHNFIGGQLNPVSVAQDMRDAGIPGIKYLDAGSRSAGEGSHNSVVFDPATIEILRKYGIAGLGLGLGAAATQQGNGQ